jgi:hypothetical protein
MSEERPFMEGKADEPQVQDRTYETPALTVLGKVKALMNEGEPSGVQTDNRLDG